MLKIIANFSLILLLISAAPFSAHAKPKGAVLVNKSLTGGPGNDDSFSPKISGNGQFALYRSDATDLVNGDTNEKQDAFLTNLKSGKTVRLSVNSSKIEGNGSSSPAAISSDGRYVLMTSNASNLVSEDTDTNADVFQVDTKTGTIRLVSFGKPAVKAQGTNFAGDISDNGFFALFSSSDNNLTDDDENGSTDVFLRNLQTGTTSLISKSRPGTIPKDTCYVRNHSFAPPAKPRYIVFICEHEAGNNDESSIFRYDLKTGTTALVSKDFNGVEQFAFSGDATISKNGRYIAFSSLARLVPEDTNDTSDVYIRDMKKDSIKLAVTGDGGARPNGKVQVDQISANAKYLLISSNATNLGTPGNPTGLTNTYRYNIKSKKAEKLNINKSGVSGDMGSFGGSLSADGSKAVFDSIDSNLVTSGSTRGFGNIYLRTFTPPKPK